MGGRLIPRAAATTLALVAGILFGAVAPALAIDLPPTQTGVYVYDLAGIWSPATRASAQRIAETIRTRTEAQLAIVSLPTGFSSVDLQDAKVDALTIMNTWGVGRRGINDGLVVLFDMDTSLRHGQLYMYAGSGFQDRYLTEDESTAITDGTMVPKAKSGDLDAALLDGLAKVDHVVQPGGNPDRAGEALIRLLLSLAIVGVALVVFGRFLLVWWRRGRDAE